MCTLLLACTAHPKYRLILAANRDEFYDRPTAAAAFWEDAPHIFAGRDLVHGGTWLGVTNSGRIAALTNYREPHEARKDGPSRGHLVSDFLKGEEPAEDFLTRVRAEAGRYSGFNLLLGEPDRLFHYSNRNDQITPLGSGIYGLSNNLLDTPWPKVVRGKSALAGVLEKEDFSPKEIFDILADRTKAADEELPDTGVGLEWERVLSSIFIASERYGTRSSTVLLVDQDREGKFMERSFDEDGVRETMMTFDWGR